MKEKEEEQRERIPAGPRRPRSPGGRRRWRGRGGLSLSPGETRARCPRPPATAAGPPLGGAAERFNRAAATALPRPSPGPRSAPLRPLHSARPARGPFPARPAACRACGAWRRLGPAALAARPPPLPSALHQLEGHP